MKELTVIFASILFFFVNSPAQSGRASNWLSFVIQSDAREGVNNSWQQVQRLEISKRVGALPGQGSTAGVIRFDPKDKEVRFTFTNFTINGAWFSPSEVVVEYQEDGRTIGPIKALPGAGNSDYFQMTLRFREKTDRSLLSIRLAGRTSGQFVRDTINTVMVWGSGAAETANIQVAYLDENSRDLAARSPYANSTSSYGATQDRISATSGAYAIQLGAYTVLPDSRQFSAAAPYGQVFSRRIGGLNYVRVGPYQDAALAQQYLQRIRESYPEAYIVMEDSTPQQPAAPAISYSPYEQTSQYGDVVSPRIPAAGSQTAKGTNTYLLPSGVRGYAIQLSSYKDEDNAVALWERLKERGISDVYVWKKDGNNRVVVAPFPNKSGAANYLATLKSQYSQDGIVTYIE